MCASTVTITEIGGKDRITCIACEFVHWDNPKPVTATLVPFEGGLVLVKRKFEPYVGDWCLPGGFIEAHEEPNQSAAREVLDETGLTIDGLRLLEALAPGHSINVIILFYLATSAIGKLIAGDDASDVGSFKENRLPENVAFQHHRTMIARWFKTMGKFDC